MACLLRILQPAVAGVAVEPAGEFVASRDRRSWRSTATRHRAPRRVNPQARRARRRRSWICAWRSCAGRNSRRSPTHDRRRCLPCSARQRARIAADRARTFCDAGGLLLLQIGALMPDARERVIAALANGPHDDADRFARALDVERRIMQPRARHEEERPEVGSSSLRCGSPCRTARDPSSGKSAYVASRPSPQ